MKTDWPKLSETLPHPREPDTCQACGNVEEPVIRWREHDDSDQPTDTVVILCEPCSDTIIEPHPRLYGPMPTSEPLPGTMGICVACIHRRDGEIICRHPLLKANGGTGLPMDLPTPIRSIVCGRGHGGRGCQTVTTYMGSVTCRGREFGALEEKGEEGAKQENS